LYSRAENEAQSIKVLNTTEKASVKKYESDGTLVAHDGNTNATSGAEGSAAIAARAIFIDAAEAVLAENQERGLNAPGWWQYTSYTDASGETRHKAVHLAAFKSAPANTADADDAIAADVASAITISAQPADVGAAADPFTGTFAVTAAASTGSVVYQWQRQTASGTRWSNVTTSLDGGVYSGEDGATLTITGAAKADLDGYKYRVKLTSDAGAEEVISDAATLTYA
jgi:hypothetical protein